MTMEGEIEKHIIVIESGDRKLTIREKIFIIMNHVIRWFENVVENLLNKNIDDTKQLGKNIIRELRKDDK